MNRASSATGWARNPVMKLPNLDPTQASSYDLGWTLNPFTGCQNHIKGLCNGGGFPCYAYKLAEGRLRQRYLDNTHIAPTSLPYNIQTTLALRDPFYPRLWPERLEELDFTAKKKHFTVGGASKVQPKGIFVCDMSDLFGIGIPEEWTRRVLEVIRMSPSDRFYLLTKQPQNLPQWGSFPENCRVGVTATNRRMYVEALRGLKDVRATVRFISFEPVLERIVSNEGWIVQHAPGANPDDAFMLHLTGVGWVIIGALTGTLNDLKLTAMRYPDLALMPYGKKWTLQPKIEWVEEIVQACDKAGAPVFLKDNLKPLLEALDLTRTVIGSLTRLVVKENKDTQRLSRQRGWYELRQEMPCGEG